MSGPVLLHASCVAIGDRAVLLLGPSGAGKSDVALRLIEQGAALVSDDQTLVRFEGGHNLASAPPSIAGMIEARHAGLVKGLPHVSDVPVHLVVELFADANGLERLPQRTYYSLLDRSVRSLKLAAFEASTPIKIRLALQGLLDDA